MVPAGSYANRNYCAHQVHLHPVVDPVLLDLLADAQTSGGLLIALPEDQAESLLGDLKAHGVSDAAIIGRITGPGDGLIQIS